MRNLKKILALVLALVMSLSLVTIASGADFTDADEIELTEAVDVMTTIGVFEGHNTGAFAPKGTLTREQAAKIITYMLLGENADKLSVGTSRYSDVAVTRWSAPAIEYCSTLGIVAGNGDGTFNPAGTLTGYAFAKMLLTALGYKAEVEGFTGSAWTVNVARYALEVGLDKGMGGITWGATLTREQAAQMALNAIKAPLVAYDGSTTIIVNGAEVSFGTGDAYYVTTTLAKEQRISNQTLSNTDMYTVEFGERYFPGLRLASGTDAFDRPSYTWTYNTEEIGSYVNYDLLVETYTTGVTGKDLYELLTSSIIKEYEVYAYVDGKVNPNIKNSNMIRTNTITYDETGKGVLTQVFVDHDAEDIIITSINTYLAQANADYNEKKETLSLNVKQADGYVFNSTTISLNDFAGIEKYKADDFVLVNVAEGANSKYDIIKVFDPEIMTDVTLTKYAKGSYVVADEQYDYAKKGTVYNAAPLTDYDKTALTNYTYNLFLDQYGYLIGTEIYSGEANYLFLTGYDLDGSNLAITTATGGAIFLDGTFSKIKIDVSATQDNLDKDTQNTAYPDLKRGKVPGATNGESEYNMWFTYNTTEKNGETIYTLNPVAANRWATMTAKTTDTKINSASVRVVGDVVNTNVAYGNDDSVYVTVDTGAVDLSTAKGITKVTGTYTGVQSVDLKVFSNSADGDAYDKDNVLTNTPAIMTVFDDKDLYIIGAIVVGEDASATDNYAYVLEGAQNEYVDSSDNYYWDFTAVVDGEIKTLTVKTKYASVISAIRAQCGANKNGLMKLTYDADGYVIGATTVVDGSPSDKVYGNSDWGTVIDAGNETLYTMQFIGASGTYKLTVAGRTLYAHTNDAGLTLETGAPVIVVQEEKPNVGTAKLTYTAYSTIAQALDSLKDKSDFEGWISAVLNNKGTAEYIVINSKDAVGYTSDDGSSPRSDVTVTLNKGTNTITVASKNGTPISLTATEIQETVGYYLRDKNIIPAAWTMANDTMTRWPATVQAVEQTAIGNITLTLNIAYSNVSSSTPA